MSKYVVLQRNQNLMARFGIHSHSLDSQTNEFFRSVPAFLITSVTVVFTIISCIVFIFKNIDNFESIFNAAMCVLAGTEVTCMFVSIGLNMKSIKTLHIKLQEIIDTGKLHFKLLTRFIYTERIFK